MNTDNSTSKLLLGIDEAGRGPLAGPLVVGGVVLGKAQQIAIRATNFPIKDSKVLTEKQREVVYDYMLKTQISFHTVVIDVPEINENGIGWANTEGIKRVITYFELRTWRVRNYEIIVDGYFPQEKIAVAGVDVRTQVDADATVMPVILAGIVAKVTRDRIMKSLHEEFPVYQWMKNKGYGTREHIQALVTHGSTAHHRKIFVDTAVKKLAYK